MPVEGQNCGNCSAFTGSRCSAHPPIPVFTELQDPSPMTVVQSHFPEVAADDWCREWQSKDELAGEQTLTEITDNVQLKTGSGRFKTLVIQLPGTQDVWRVWDSIGTNAAGGIIFAATFDNANVQEGCVIALNWPFSVGCFLEIPPGGVCAAVWE